MENYQKAERHLFHLVADLMFFEGMSLLRG